VHVVTGDETKHQYSGNGEPDGSERRAETDVHRAPKLIAQRRMARSESLGLQHESSDENAAERVGKSKPLEPEINNDGEIFRQQRDGNESEDQHRHVKGERPAMRQSSPALLTEHLAPTVAHRLGEECAVPHRVDDQKDGLQQHGELDRLVGCLDGVGRRYGVVRYDQCEPGEGGDDHRKACAPARLYSCSQ
jgi:hypothetical protein